MTYINEGLGLECLTPHLTIFQLYRGGYTEMKVFPVPVEK
jgi:hypothetical protein